jgi:hypothetical protein
MNKHTVYSFDWLCDKMRSRERVTIKNSLGVIHGIINGIRPEDGSGNHWLITINDNLTNCEIYVRTA